MSSSIGRRLTNGIRRCQLTKPVRILALLCAGIFAVSAAGATFTGNAVAMRCATCDGGGDGGGGSGQPQYTYRLTLARIVCNKQNESGEDEPYLKVNGEDVWHKDDMEEGNTVDLNMSRTNTWGFNIDLWEKDGGLRGDDDHLGTITVDPLTNDDQIGLDIHPGSFTEEDANYTLYFKVAKIVNPAWIPPNPDL